ncbi:MAG: type I-E CRISPR-associated protein Cas7/Cse4/CasC [Deltaproteobacteria bacterium]|jgi:CRISPR system Cascade subunit CasC|uniref:type I-E CRISPR-associated protein Cas7/Cse4/CasC n=1 Tax=Hydrosulfovibrio ferrireducens TaxID=2934181 RepID=UPI0012115980|nr:MAG: type I-E CRISPR-associated protein Cas7/Cse4/CasC [Deltaproteobacteria bacterium]
MKNFINFHILISHSPSCLNRDDMNMQKSAVFGGERRVRISSQSLKRAIRKSEYYRQHLGEASIRSRDLELLKDEFLEQLGDEFKEETIKEALERFAKTKSSEDEDDDIQEEGDSEKGTVKKIAVAPWITDEFKVICQIVKEVRDVGLSSEEEEKAKQVFEKQKGKKKKPLENFIDAAFGKKIDKQLETNREALLKAIGSAVDVALSGRMATAGLMSTIDGSLAVAHVLTTHSVDSDIDWFTAVDDLQELGSGHLDTQEFSSGVFYRYASLNLRQLQVNLGLLPDMKSPETKASRERALEIAVHLLHMLATVVPSAKQQTFAAHNLADLAMVSFSDIPVSLANAFEKSIRSYNGSGFKEPSINALHTYWQQVHSGYGLTERCGEFLLGQAEVPSDILPKKTLEELKTWVRSNGEG